MHSLRLLRCASLASLLTPGALAQNTADNCSQAPLVADGIHAFDTTSATPSGVEPNTGMCEDFGQSNPESLHNDIWFEWMPLQDGAYRIRTCDDVNYDSKLAVYMGSCGSLVPLGCNDDGLNCSNFSSQLELTGISTSVIYYIQVGGYSANDTGAGNLTIEAISGGSGAGPDIAVSGVGNNDFINYGTSGGIRAYSFATTSCNVGDEVVNWFQGIGNDHPLIGQNLYRIDNGRIEQLGYSFLKHGFCAVNENSCGTCQSTSCDTLGVGCADTYSANLNDGDDGASKDSVNPTLGTYSGNPGPVGDPPTINGRLQVVDSELTGTLIAESQYVSEHDHGAGLARNNASWRQVSAATNGNLSGAGPVNMSDPGIFAWEALSGATINEVVNVDEGGTDVHGYFFVGYQVTDLGGGLWRYEYAAMNFNSDRSGRTFEVPVPDGVNLTSLFFRDVNHHSGDPYSNTPWSFTHGGDVARWETETFAQNSDANALRWGTLYNFGFTADGAPQAVDAVIGLFKPGTPSSLSAPVQGPSSGFVDCNGNGVDDADDIANGTSEDCDGNGVPDECDPDCDSDGTPDGCETDCNNNGTPDDCESFADCNSNGIPDDCEPDCDNDGTPDDCEVDCNNNGTPDDCESFSDCNSNGIPDDCEPDCDNDGTPDDCEPDCDNDGTPDDCEADCDNDGTPDDCEADCNNNGTPDDCESFSDCNSNGIPDECEPDCDNDGTPDDCEIDCNNNGTPDDCESFSDCNSNGIPDDCEPDCDNDGTPDNCEADCNNNGTPDDCESFTDCNSNGIPDECEADCDNDGTPDDCEVDCNENGTPDDCESFSDCNTNGIPDECDIQSGTSLDLNGNDVPDECECSASNYCQTSANSVGPGALISSSGSHSVSVNDTTLLATGLPPNQFGLFFYGQNQANASFGNGFRCIGTPLVRLNVTQANGSGDASYFLDMTDLPANGQIGANEDWNFQMWYRDPMGGGSAFNLTDGLAVRFCE